MSEANPIEQNNAQQGETNRQMNQPQFAGAQQGVPYGGVYPYHGFHPYGWHPHPIYPYPHYHYPYYPIHHYHPHGWHPYAVYPGHIMHHGHLYGTGVHR
jgi:hypothetical protein